MHNSIHKGKRVSSFAAGGYVRLLQIFSFSELWQCQRAVFSSQTKGKLDLLILISQRIGRLRIKDKESALVSVCVCVCVCVCVRVCVCVCVCVGVFWLRAGLLALCV